MGYLYEELFLRSWEFFGHLQGTIVLCDKLLS